MEKTRNINLSQSHHFQPSWSHQTSSAVRLCSIPGPGVWLARRAGRGRGTARAGPAGFTGSIPSLTGSTMPPGVPNLLLNRRKISVLSTLLFPIHLCNKHTHPKRCRDNNSNRHFNVMVPLCCLHIWVPFKSHLPENAFVITTTCMLVSPDQDACANSGAKIVEQTSWHLTRYLQFFRASFCRQCWFMVY